MVMSAKTCTMVCASRFGFVAALVALAVWPMADAAPSLQRTKQQPTSFGQGDAMDFLQKYGYLKGRGSNGKGTAEALLSKRSFKDAIRAYQAFSGLPVTGELDESTVQLMRTPRCGVKDVEPTAPAKGRPKRYTLQGSKWGEHALTFRLSQPTTAAGTTKSKGSGGGGGGGGGLASWLEGWFTGRGGGATAAEDGAGAAAASAVERLGGAAGAEATVERALGVWAEASGLSFAPAAAGAAPDLDVRFERGSHGHCDAFDGRGGTLAHAYYPVFGGAAHFDADEHWTRDQFRGTNFFQVAVHEFGHSLGLQHSDHPDAVMAPVYRGYDPQYALHEDDIEAIQALYGSAPQLTQQQQEEEEYEDEERNNTEDDGEEKNEEEEDEDEEKDKDDEGEDDEEALGTPVNDLCDDPSVDTMFNTVEGDIYVLKGAVYYRLRERGGVLPGYPRPLAERWPGLPSGVNAAFASAVGKTYFFKGALYWRYDAGGRLDDGFPRRIAQGLPGVPDGPDAALLRPADGNIYFFKGSQYWQYAPASYPPVAASFPRPISQWQGVPAGLNAALFHGGYTYFFKGGLYYRFDDASFKVDEGSPPFPRSSAAWWFGCGRKAHAHGQLARAHGIPDK